MLTASMSLCKYFYYDCMVLSEIRFNRLSKGILKYQISRSFKLEKKVKECIPAIHQAFDLDAIQIKSENSR